MLVQRQKLLQWLSMQVGSDALDVVRELIGFGASDHALQAHTMQLC